MRICFDPRRNGHLAGSLTISAAAANDITATRTKTIIVFTNETAWPRARLDLEKKL